MVTTLYLVRHGETEGSEVKRYKGSIDVPLSEKGIEQITKLAQHMANRLNGSNSLNGLKAVYCSPLIRALKSAEIFAEPYGLKPIVIPDLRERSFGIWEGMSFNEIKDMYPEEFDAWAGNPLKYSPMGGESTIEVRDRVIRVLGNILSNHNEERIAIVAHGGVNRIILCHIIGIPLDNIFRIEQDFAAINIIEFHDKYPVVKLLNGVFHG
jgi:alpha-ribazole phosphatase/probable phosphoglycerate mutase